MSVRQAITKIGLLATLTACNQTAKIAAPGNLGDAVKVTGDLQIVMEQPDKENKDVYAVVFAALETSSVVFCKDNKTDSCSSGKTTEMTFQRREESGFYFISANPLSLIDGTELLFLGYISNNGGKPSQTGRATFYKGTLSDPDDLDNDSETNIDNISTITPNQQNGGLDMNVLGDIFKQLLGGANNQIQPINPILPNTQPNIPVPQTNPPIVQGGGQTDSLVPNPNNIALSQSEFEVIRLTNAKRQEQGKTALIVQNSIMVTARESSRLMKSRNTLVHGLTSGWNGENIANGYPTAAQVVTGWINSPGHYRNMIGNFKYIGVGDTSAEGSGAYWTQQFNN